jgi:hypothetical protein
MGVLFLVHCIIRLSKCQNDSDEENKVIIAVLVIELKTRLCEIFTIFNTEIGLNV